MAGTGGNAFYAVFITMAFNIALYLLNEHSVLSKWVKHRGSLAVTNKRNAVHPTKRPEGFFAWDLLDPSHVVVGHHVGMLPILLYRQFVLGFFLFAIFYQGVWGSGLPKTWITFFTNWDFVAMALYSVLGIAVSAKGHYQKGPPSPIWGLLEKAFVIVFVTAASNAIFLTAFYWAVLYDPEESPGLDNYFRHGVNVIIMLGEVVISRLPIVSYHLQIPFAFTTVYAIFFWIYRGAAGVWVYEALDWSKTSSIAYYTILPILIILSFYLLYLVAHLRERWSRKPFKGFEEAKTDDGIELAGV